MVGIRMRCSFCGRRDSEVAKLVAGPTRLLRRVYICDRCAEQSVQIMGAASGGEQPGGERTPLLRRMIGWLRPGRHNLFRTA
jgi:hypothetical protein